VGDETVTRGCQCEQGDENSSEDGVGVFFAIKRTVPSESKGFHKITFLKEF